MAHCCLIHCYREQARSHIGFVVLPGTAIAADSCGSELARERAITSNISTSRPTAVARELAPAGPVRRLGRSSPKLLELVDRNLQIGHAISLGRRQVSRPHIHLDRRQQ